SKEDIKKLFDNQSDEYILAKCAMYGYLDFIKDIIEEKGIHNNKLDSLLSISSSHGYLDIVKYLIEKGADINSIDALKSSIHGNRPIIIDYLLSNSNISIDDGSNLLTTAVHFNRHDIVKIILKYIKYPLKDLKYQIDMAKSQGDKKMVNILKEYIKKIKPNKLTRIKSVFNIDESLKENVQYKKVSNSLFWNYINRLKSLDTKFELNTTHIKGVDNSLEVDDYILFLETSEINTDEVRYELKYSSVLSGILNYLDDKVDNKVKFYIGFKKNSELHFGFIFDDKKYKIGYIYYQSSDFFKLRNLISKTNKEINLLDLSKRFKSKISTMVAINTLVSKYLSKYDDIKIYNSVVDDGFCITIECKDNDILNKNYLDKIIESNIKLSRVEYVIEQERCNNKTIYIIIIK
ncbi:ankyrin repeat domain-containing protein, partial [Candidatus Babeliales bacterium]|nr:ankyrin repeat domain-containing protein [Candidatus Babeliales bacterium]